MKQRFSQFIAFVNSKWSNFAILGIAIIISYFSYQGLISSFRGNTYQDVFQLQELFQEYTASIEDYSRQVVSAENAEQILSRLLLRDNVFQVRLIDSSGLERAKFDEYGFNNKNTVTTRSYWNDVSALDTDRWLVTKAEFNIENDPETGEEIITNQTIRYFYRFPEHIQTNDSHYTDYFAVNLDYTKLEAELDTIFRNQKLFLLESQNLDSPKEYLSGTNWITEIPLKITFDNNRWTILGTRFTYDLSWFYFLSICFVVALYLLKESFVQWQSKRLLNERMEGRDKFVQTWVNMASHHFRHPLANISARLDILKYKKEPPSKSDLEQIQNSFNDFLEVFEYLKKLQILNDLDNREFKWHSLKTINELAMNRKATSIETIGIPSEFENIEIYVDPLPFEWAISEIIDNSIKHSKGTKVALSLNHTDKYLFVRIEDDGEGIPSKVREIINQRSLKQDKGFETGSFGLGLLQFIKIMDQHKFTVHADNPGIGGSRIEIGIPNTRVLRK